MECTWHVLLCVLVELLPAVELWPCWEERTNLAAVAWPTVSWENERETKRICFQLHILHNLHSVRNGSEANCPVPV